MSSREMKRGRPVGVTRFGEKLVLWRCSNGTVACIADRCCHRGASISHGKVVHDRAACPFHGFEYDPDGKVAVIPAYGKNTPVPENFRVRSYAVREKYGFVWMWYGKPRDDLPEIKFFNDLKMGFEYGEFSEQWHVHYSRAIENQLDVVHLPFVHATTIGRGGKTVVNGPVVKWDGTLMTFYVNNTVDEGQAPKTADEIEDYEKLFSLQLQMPNLWQNRISSKLRVMAAFAPIDDENTMIYMRFYHKFLKKPAACRLVDSAGNFANKVILHQDRRVVLTQIPLKSELIGDENLVRGDLPVIEYRKKRQELKDAAKDGSQ
jgi:phenylpropionate dioxygenase-like ring-hydroxylating dioxygenase large terminal subunit